MDKIKQKIVLYEPRDDSLLIRVWRRGQSERNFAFQSLLRQQDCSNVGAVASKIASRGLDVYLGGSVIKNVFSSQKANGNYGDIDILAVGSIGNDKITTEFIGDLLSNVPNDRLSIFDYRIGGIYFEGDQISVPVKFRISRPTVMGNRFTVKPVYPANTTAKPIDLMVLTASEFEKGYFSQNPDDRAANLYL